MDMKMKMKQMQGERPIVVDSTGWEKYRDNEKQKWDQMIKDGIKPKNVDKNAAKKKEADEENAKDKKDTAKAADEKVVEKKRQRGWRSQTDRNSIFTFLAFP